MAHKSWLLVALFMSVQVSGYRIGGGDLFFGSAMGVNVNVYRQSDVDRQTPRAWLPLALTSTYAVDDTIGLETFFVTQFSAGAVGLMPGVGAKYWFTHFNAPYLPYIGVGVAPNYYLPLQSGKSEFKLGAIVDVGFDFFLLANLLVGTKFQMNPLFLFGTGQRMEFAVSGLLTVAFRS